MPSRGSTYQLQAAARLLAACAALLRGCGAPAAQSAALRRGLKLMTFVGAEVLQGSHASMSSRSARDVADAAVSRHLALLEAQAAALEEGLPLCAGPESSADFDPLSLPATVAVWVGHAANCLEAVHSCCQTGPGEGPC